MTGFGLGNHFGRSMYDLNMIRHMNNSVVWNGQQLQTTFNEGKCHFTLSSLVYFRWEPKHLSSTHTHKKHSRIYGIGLCVKRTVARMRLCKWKWKCWSCCWYMHDYSKTLAKPNQIRWRAAISQTSNAIMSKFYSRTVQNVYISMIKKFVSC